MREFKKFSRSEMNRQLNDINEKMDAVLDAVLILADRMSEDIASEPVEEKTPPKKGKTLRKKPKA